MDFKKTLLTMLAIFCVVVSAASVCAADGDGYDGWAGSNYQDYGGYAGSQYPDGYEGGYAGSNYQDEGGWAGSQYNATAEESVPDRPLIDPDYAHMEAAGEPTNQTGNATVPAAGASNDSPAAENASAATPAHTLPATGNPIVMLIGVTALIGGCAVLRRKK